MKSIWTAVLVLCLCGLVRAQEKRPNIIVILADDMGYSDIGCFGGEIDTPNLNALAADGLRLTQFYNGGRCCPSRAALLTGLYSHEAGVGLMSSDQHRPGYYGHLNEQCVTIPEVLKTAGYRTYMSGKWHLSKPGPIERGFEEYFGILGGQTDYWDEKNFKRLPEGHATRKYAEGKFYSTDAITDYAMDFIADARGKSQPYFLYMAYNAPHFPLHAPKAEIAKYEARYQMGWDVIRQQRYERMVQMGLIDKGWAMSPRSIYEKHAKEQGGVNPAWDSLSPERHADLVRRMSCYAGAIDKIDQNVGRLVEDLRSHGELDNTFILFLSDNGGNWEWGPFGFDGTNLGPNVMHRGVELEELGSKGTFFSYGSGWANASNTPFRMYKHYINEGGISTPLIMHWPAGMKRKGELDGRVGHITDIMPTCVELAGATYPKEREGKAILAEEGVSLLGAARGNEPAERTVFWEHEHNKAVRKGNWKLVAIHGMPWELYDMKADRTELKDVSDQHPEIARELEAEWDAWAKRCHVDVETKGRAGETPATRE